MISALPIFLAFINVVVMSICTMITLKWFYTGSKRERIGICVNYVTITLLLVVNVLMMSLDESYNDLYRDGLSVALVLFGIVVGPTLTMLYSEYFK